MEDLSLHILDVCQNAVEAGASLIEITIDENSRENSLEIIIKDNGRGLDELTRKNALDPFFTTKKGKRIGLGLPMLAQAAKEAAGGLVIQSKKGNGTTVTARFVQDHIDRKPIGDMTATLMALLGSGESGIDIKYHHKKDDEQFKWESRNEKA